MLHQERIRCFQSIDLEPGFLRKKSRHRISKKLELNPDQRRRIDFYARETKQAPRDKTIIQEISRKILLDLAREYDYVISRAPALEIINVRELTEKGENEKNEFKSSMCWNYSFDFNENGMWTFVDFYACMHLTLLFFPIKKNSTYDLEMHLHH